MTLQEFHKRYTEDQVSVITNILGYRGILKDFVVLKEDENGRYIEYAFVIGTPEHNRCLSWYAKLQPNALKRSGHDPEKWKLQELNHIYQASQWTCGGRCVFGSGENIHKCSPSAAKHWTYEEPIKHCCWGLKLVDFDNFKITFDELFTAIEFN